MSVVVPCPYCGREAVFRTTSDHIYGRDYGSVWHCTPCRAWVGCHPDGRPLGRLANAELRAAKTAAHAAFDPLWKRKIARHGCTKKQARGLGYAWLARQLELALKDCHIGMFDVATCRQVVEVCMACKEKARG